MTQVSFASKFWASGAEPEAQPVAAAADPGDAADFQRWLRPEAAAPDPAAAPTSLGQILNAASASLHDREQAFGRTLLRAGRTGDPLESLAVQRQMSDLYISHGLAIKIIAKTTQAMEQMMRMQ